MVRARFLTLAAAAVLLAGCERSREIPVPRDDGTGEAPPAPVVALPEASLLRFEATQGTGFSREGWELEILQMGGDIRVSGSLRTGGSFVPVYRSMGRDEFADIWSWISAFPLDRLKVREDTTAAPEGWRKSLKFDAVLGPEERELSENEWTRPPANAPWLGNIEDRLHLMVLDLAGKELDRQEKSAAVPDSNGVVRKALEAIGESPPAAFDSTP